MARENPQQQAPSLVDYARRLCTERLAAYALARHDVEEHANLEELALGGGYAYRQVAELIQNAADAISEDPSQSGTNRIEITADRHGLWAANTGAPIDEAGVRALLNAASSNKRANQIGRFGLGFKSLLLLGGRIDVVSRTVWLHFDPAATRERIRSDLGLPGDAPAPGLRLADAGEWTDGLDAIETARRFDWATTIVLATIESGTSRLAVFDEIRKFPEEFLLFLPCDVELVLIVGDTKRHLRRRTVEDGCVVIEDMADASSVPQRWRIFETIASIRDSDAIEDARKIHYREAVPVIWAAPVGTPPQGGRFRETRTGKFFAFFPTSTDSRAHGIINAPWKLNNDRTALVKGAWNDALMDEAAKLIAGRITELGMADDPGAVLDGFPRELQSASDPAAPLVRSLWDLLPDAPVIPNCDGEYCQGADLLRPPTDAAAIAAAWSSLAPPEACVAHVHPTCLSTAGRVGRLNALAGRLKDRTKSKPALDRSPAFEWLEMTATKDVDAAKEVIGLVDSFTQQEKGVWWETNRSKLRVILTADDVLDTAANVVLGDHPEPPLCAVHPQLAADPETRRILQEIFHVRDKSDVTVIDHIDARIDAAGKAGDWAPVWDLLRGLPFEDAGRIVTKRQIRVRTLGGWGRRQAVYRKGELVSDALIASISEENRATALAMIVDDDWHAQDHALLDEMGIEPNPDPAWRTYKWPAKPETPAELWMDAWRRAWLERYHVHLQCRPSRDQLSPASFAMPLGWEWLLLCGAEQRLAVSHWIMELIEEADEEEFGPVEFRHANRFAYATASYPHPVWSLLAEAGVLAQSDISIPFSSLMTANMPDRAEMLPSLVWWKSALEKLDAAGAGTGSLVDANESWPDWLAYASRERCGPAKLAQFYEAAANAGFTPEEVASADGPVPLSAAHVASSERDARMAEQAGLATVHLSPTASGRWIAAGAKSLSESRRVGWDDAEGGQLVTFLEIEPALAGLLEPEKSSEACVTMIGKLTQQLGGESLPMPWLLSDGTVYLDRHSFDILAWPEKIALLVEAGEAAGWMLPDYDIEQILQSGPVAKRHAVAAEPDLPSRLLRATGGPDPILRLFEPEVRTKVAGDPMKAASVAIMLLGPSLLADKGIREAMAREGLDPPTTWSGAKAPDFVAAIGFPPEYAVAPQRRRDAEISVQGPVPYCELHDFQVEVIEQLDTLIADRSARRRRAVISLPTGAGKTRVAAECCVTRILRDGPGRRVVLWIAQSDELCEQAVQCFRELWSNLGAEDETLRIVRFWGGHGNPKAPEHGEPTVVVATIQTLQSRMSNSDVAWIGAPDLVVIDECHHALTPTYTGTFSWLGGSREEEREPPVIGLSATPFRGSNEDETKALARRFDGRLFPQQQSRLFEELQGRGVLARFTYTRLEIQERLDLSEEEQRSLERFNRLPEAAMERLGAMSDRNERIVREIAEADEQSALVFATSVRHARRLAARLNILGVRASAVTGETDRNSRRWFVESFRRGDIRVLCNHSALTTGFDAPATDLIVVARPVFSPSLYMQMVGRGLRGPVNGGKEECRILTVQDNLDQYTGKLAHHYFERYYVGG